MNPETWALWLGASLTCGSAVMALALKAHHGRDRHEQDRQKQGPSRAPAPQEVQAAGARGGGPTRLRGPVDAGYRVGPSEREHALAMRVAELEREVDELRPLAQLGGDVQASRRRLAAVGRVLAVLNGAAWVMRESAKNKR